MQRLLERMGGREWAGVALLAALLLTALVQTYLVAPTRRAAEALGVEVEALEAKKRAGEEARMALPVLEQVLADLRAKRASLLRSLPTEEAFTSLAEEVRVRVATSGMEVLSLSRSDASSPLPEVRAHRLSLRARGPFPKAYRLLRSLENLPRFVRVGSAVLQRADQEGLVEVEVALDYYSLQKKTLEAAREQAGKEERAGKEGVRP